MVLQTALQVRQIVLWHRAGSPCFKTCLGSYAQECRHTAEESRKPKAEQSQKRLAIQQILSYCCHPQTTIEGKSGCSRLVSKYQSRIAWKRRFNKGSKRIWPKSTKKVAKMWGSKTASWDNSKSINCMVPLKQVSSPCLLNQCYPHVTGLYATSRSPSISNWGCTLLLDKLCDNFFVLKSDLTSTGHCPRWVENWNKKKINNTSTSNKLGNSGTTLRPTAGPTLWFSNQAPKSSIRPNWEP